MWVKQTGEKTAQKIHFIPESGPVCKYGKRWATSKTDLGRSDCLSVVLYSAAPEKVHRLGTTYHSIVNPVKSTFLNASSLQHISISALVLILIWGLPACEKGMDTNYNDLTVEVAGRVLSKNGNSIDVGAYKGEILEDLLDIAPGGKHYAFEPQPARFRTLKKEFPQALVFDCALGDTTGVMNFVLAIEAPARSGFKRRQYPVNEDSTRDTVISVRRLDDVIPADVNIDFMKIDVEGAEFMVLRGGVQTVLRSRPVIVFEFGQGSAEFFGTTPEYVWDFMTGDLNMTLWLMPDWLEKKVPLGREAFIAHFNNRTEYMFLAEPTEK